jgi:8-oxo-dGTP pyrophosphatase MutT (NUDIX family)
MRYGIALVFASLLAGCVWHEGIVKVQWPKQVLRLRVGGLWEKDGKYFVDLHRGFPDSVEIFGGGVEPDESPTGALRREWREELGIEPTVGPLRMVVQHAWVYNGVQINQVDLIFEIITAPAFDRPRESGHDPVWMTIEEARRRVGVPAALFANLPLTAPTVLYVEERP